MHLPADLTRPPDSGPVRDIADPRHDGRDVSQVEHILARVEPPASSCQQQRELAVGVRGPEMLNLLGLPPATRHDLHRDRSGRCADLTDEPRNHPRRLPCRGS